MIIHLNSHHDFGSGFNVFTLGFLNIVHSCIAKVIFPQLGGERQELPAVDPVPVSQRLLVRQHISPDGQWGQHPERQTLGPKEDSL